jgi:formylglycine-generating enzyme required for sulfatase activity
VTITNGFWIGRTEVTQAAYKRVTKQNPSHFRGDNLPVEMVTWAEARAYCKAVQARLPTEAEWEYAGQGGEDPVRPGALADVAWYAANSESKTHEVARKQPNGYGLYDMLGNVWEWTSDWYGAYQSGPQVDPSGSLVGEAPILRGGSWVDGTRGMRTSLRGRLLEVSRDGNYGFRCVWNY